MRAALMIASFVLLCASCASLLGDTHECRADADCATLGADLVCDVAHEVCVEQACTTSADCGTGKVCDPLRKACVQKACTTHDDCAPYGARFACRAGSCADACFPAAFTSKKAPAIPFGAVLPLSLDTQGTENPAVRARRWSLELALREVNEDRGGVQVRNVAARGIALTFCDSKSDPKLAGRLAGALLNEGAIALVTAGSTETQQVLPVAKPRGVLVVSPSATADKLTVSGAGADETGVDNAGLFFRLAPRDRFQARALVKNLEARAGSGAKPNLAVVHENDDYGNGMAEVILKRWPTAAGKDVAFDAAKPSLDATALASLDRFTPAWIVIAGRPASAASLFKQFQSMPALKAGAGAVPIFTDSSANPALVELLGPDASLLSGALGVAVRVDDASDTYKSYRASYELLRRSDAGGGGFESAERDGTFGPQSYDALYLLTYAASYAIARADTADGLDGRALAQSMRLLNDAAGRAHYTGSGDFTPTLSDLGERVAVNVAGVSGSLDFDANGDVPGRFSICQFQGDPVSFDLLNCQPTEP